MCVVLLWLVCVVINAWLVLCFVVVSFCCYRCVGGVLFCARCVLVVLCARRVLLCL